MRIQDLYTPVIDHPDSDYPHLTKLLEMLSAQPPVPRQLDGEYPECEVEFSVGGQRIRKPVNRSNSRVTLKFPSQKNGRVIQCESQIESAGFRILELCSYVKSYLEQPAKIHFEMDGKSRWHIPDALVALRSGRMVFIEFKPDSMKDDPDLANRTRFLSTHLPLIGYHYLVIIQKQIGGIPLENAQKLLRARWPDVDMVMKERIRKTMRSLGNPTLGDVLAQLPQEPAYAFAMNRLMLDGHIRYDMFVPISVLSVITWK